MAKTETSDPTDVPAGVPEDRVDGLYGLPLDEFTPARDVLAKELRKEGKRDGAEWVKGLRKPSAPAWVVNQLARTRRREVEELVAAGKALREAHERLLAGKGQADDLRDAGARQGQAVAALVDKGQGTPRREPRSGGNRLRVRTSVRSLSHESSPGPPLTEVVRAYPVASDEAALAAHLGPRRGPEPVSGGASAGAGVPRGRRRENPI